MAHIAKSSALSFFKSDLSQELAVTDSQLLPLRAATVKCIRLTAGRMNESLQANTANAAISNQFSISETVCVKNTCLHDGR